MKLKKIRALALDDTSLCLITIDHFGTKSDQYLTSLLQLQYTVGLKGK